MVCACEQKGNQQTLACRVSPIYTHNVLRMLSCQPRVTVPTLFVYKVIRDLYSYK